MTVVYDWDKLFPDFYAERSMWGLYFLKTDKYIGHVVAETSDSFWSFLRGRKEIGVLFFRTDQYDFLEKLPYEAKLSLYKWIRSLSKDPIRKIYLLEQTIDAEKNAELELELLGVI